MEYENDFSETVGVRNPYVLAEFELDRQIDWSDEDTRSVFERAFGQPYETLFDPKHDSPLYDGIPLDGGSGPMVDGGDPQVKWRDVGTFLEGLPEYSDPIQGSPGDCYLMAALSAIAWTKPRHLIDQVKWVEEDTPDYVRFTFTEDVGTGDDVLVEVTQRLPTEATGGGLVYARSLDPLEIWPGVYEKAYAKWKTGTEGDEPSIEAISTGHPAVALSELLGFEATMGKTVDNPADSIWKVLTNDSKNDDNVTATPMVAWTYQSDSDAPGDVSYDDANVVARHAYTVLGHQVRNDTRFVFLRNPWGQAEENGGPSGWWNVKRDYTLSGINLSNINGVFGLPIEQFHRFFKGIGIARP